MAEPRVHVLVEGQTEEVLVRDVLEPRLASAGWLVTSSIVATKRPRRRSACSATARTT
ncbi:MAG TPA: hypothetical protein VGG05_27990 [Pseudonocardiaceae bacterium]|jgi:hypothetical protein